MTRAPLLTALALLPVLRLAAPGVRAAGPSDPGPIVLRTQGSFFAGGKTATAPGVYDPKDHRNPQGQTVYGDHAYVFYQIPVNAKPLPLVFVHGGGQSARTWESTPDGRDGFQNIFLRRDWSVYLVDQPRRGRAGASTEGVDLKPPYSDRRLFSLFRMGEWPDPYPGGQFPRGREALEQMFRQGTPDTGPYDIDVIADGVAAALDRTGPSILVTHSRGGAVGWHAVIRSSSVRAIVAWEPGGWPFVFPEGLAPEPVDCAFGRIAPCVVSMEDFRKLISVPIVIYYGDNIATEPCADIGRDQWRVEMQMARRFAEIANGMGGDVRVVHLPEIGITGNSHFPFADMNNVAVADLLSAWLTEKGLDR